MYEVNWLYFYLLALFFQDKLSTCGVIVYFNKNIEAKLQMLLIDKIKKQN